MDKASGTGSKWLWVGGVGSVLAALCCFTPILVIAFGAIGAGALAASLDTVLFPLLLFFVVVFAVSWMRRKGGKRADEAQG